MVKVGGRLILGEAGIYGVEDEFFVASWGQVEDFLLVHRLIIFVDFADVFEGGVDVEPEFLGSRRLYILNIGDVLFEQFGLEDYVLETSILEHEADGKFYS